MVKIQLVNGLWYRDFAGTEEENDMIELFGSTLIPTPFTSASSYETVLAAQN